MANPYVLRNIVVKPRLHRIVRTDGYAASNFAGMPRRIGNPARRRRHFIKEWREFRGLTQEQLALLFDTSGGSIFRIESLENGYTPDFLQACADALGTHPGTLLMRAPNAADADPRKEVAPMMPLKRGGQRKIPKSM